MPSLVDSERGVTTVSLPDCATISKDGSRQCDTLNSALSLLGQGMGVAALVANLTMPNIPGIATGSTYDARVTVVCPECNALKLWSKRGCTLPTLLLSLRSLETLRAGDTSIIWRLEVKPTGPASDRAFHVWPDSQLLTTAATAPTTSGDDTGAA